MFRTILKNLPIAGLLLVTLFVLVAAPRPSVPPVSSATSAPLPTFKASGRVIVAHITRGGWRFEPVPDAVMTFTLGKCCGGMPPAPSKTDAEGRWAADVPIAGTSGALYVVTPRKPGFIFKPRSIAFTEAHPWLEELNFQVDGR